MVMSAGSRLGRTRVPTVGAKPASAQIATTGTFTGSSTSVFVMAGLGLTITPAVTGNLMVSFAGWLTSSAVTINEGTILQIAYGTGTPPVNNAAATGTLVGEPQRYQNAIALTTAADLKVPIALHSLIAGLTLGVTYWIDIQVEAVTGASVITTNDPVLTAIELGGSQPSTNIVTGPAGPGALFGGRLTLTSGTPVLIANTTAATSIFYTPYTSNWITIFNGVNFATYPFSEVSVALDTSNFLSGTLYDLFVFLNAGTPTLGYGPAWTSKTARSAATAIARLNGIWTNNITITLRTNSTTTFSVGANQATYVGTAWATANGQTAMNFLPAAAAGGNNSILGLFNAYNRLPMMVVSRDSTTSWTYATNTWRAADGNANNAVNFVDGLGEVLAHATYIVSNNPTAASAVNAVIGINLNSTTATPGLQAVSSAAATNIAAELAVSGIILPALGFNTLNAVENTNAVSVTFYGSGVGTGVGQSQGLTAVVSI
jgi:hypothetical protein